MSAGGNSKSVLLLTRATDAPSATTALGYLPIASGHYTKLLCDSSLAEFTIQLDDPAVTKSQWVALGAFEPAAICVWVQRDLTAFTWGGLLMRTEYDLVAGTLKLICADFGAYLGYCYQTVPANYQWVGDIAQLAYTWALGGLRGTLSSSFPAYTGIYVSGTYTATGITQTIPCVPWGTTVLDMIKAWHNIQGGYDWAFDIAQWPSNGYPYPYFRVSYPRRGLAYTTKAFAIDVPAHVISGKIIKDAGRFTTVLHVTGAPGVTADIATNPAGYVEMMQTENRADLGDNSSATVYGNGIMATWGTQPPVTADLTVPGDVFYGLGCDVGDEIALHVGTPIFTGPLYMRLVGYDVTLASSSTLEKVQLIFGAHL